MKCAECHEERARVFEGGRCTFCLLGEGGSINIIGVMPRAQGRKDIVNPYRDTMRAIEFMAQSPRERATGDMLSRWSNQAYHTLPDTNISCNPDEMTSPDTPSGEDITKVDREGQGQIKELWDKAVYERQVLKQKPTTDIQARNYAAVDRIST